MEVEKTNGSCSVSVIIPACNARASIGQAIDSVLAQTRRPEEILIVDDGSTDGTGETVKQYGNQVTYLYQENAGAAQARNTGIQAARCEWISFLDADDLLKPKKIQLQLELLERNPDLAWCYGNYQSCLFGTDQVHQSHDPVRTEGLLSGLDYFNDYLEAFAAGIPGHTNTILVKKTVLNEVGNFNHSLPWGQDADICFRIAYKYPKAGYVRECLAVTCFRRPGSITEQHWLEVQPRCDFLQRHLDLSRQAGRGPLFEACAASLLRRWIPQLFDGAPPEDMLRMIRQFRPLVPKTLYAEAWLRCRFPRMAPAVLNPYFKMKNQMRGGR